MKRLAIEIESSKQIGCPTHITLNGDSLWCDAAIQKHNGNYIAHVSIIKEENMAQEKYDLFFTKEFPSLEDAFRCIEENRFIKFTDNNCF